MFGSMKGLKVTILGGDKREIEIYNCFSAAGATLKVIGFEKMAIYFSHQILSELEEGLKDADVIILPLTGIDSDGKVYAPYAEKEIILRIEDLYLFKKDSLVLSGSIPQNIKKIFKERKVCYKETAPINEISIRNALPTAEGAIQKAMEKSDVTIHGSKVFVLGFGRCGLILADKLKGLKAHVTIAARNKEALSYALSLGYYPLEISKLKEIIGEANFIFNTIPEVILTAELLCLLSKDVVIIDIATSPGGVDYAAAYRLGLKAQLLPGIPGKVAPKSAGKILAEIYPDLIMNILKGRDCEDCN